jgi:hypothetical protein
MQQTTGAVRRESRPLVTGYIEITSSVLTIFTESEPEGCDSLAASNFVFAPLNAIHAYQIHVVAALSLQLPDFLCLR